MHFMCEYGTHMKGGLDRSHKIRECAGGETIEPAKIMNA